MREAIAPGKERWVAGWLYLTAFLIFCMIILGGLTRLTDSGLSMVDWKPIMGAVPPTSEADWLSRFEQYKQFPEYKLENAGMSLEEFKFIFLMEYGHRMLGRLIGLVFAAPFFFFWARRWIKRPMVKRGLLLLFLGGLQGFIGWFMVQSGLVDIPRVAQERLTLHLSVAILTLTLSLWYAFQISAPVNRGADAALLPRLKTGVSWLLLALAFQIVTGGFVAGLRAGAMYNTFPTMNGRWLPHGLWDPLLGWANLTDNPTLIQFIHRCGAYIVTATVLTFIIRHGLRLRSRKAALTVRTMGALLLAQVGLGIATLTMGVPTALASMHQGVAVLLWCSVIFLFHQTKLDQGQAAPFRDAGAAGSRQAAA